MNTYDLVVRGGTVVTPGATAECDLGISDGTIGQLGGSMQGREELDASGALVLPGGLHMHVHLTEPEESEGEPAWIDVFESGSAAAIAGGVTTFGNMTFPADGDSLHQSLARDLEAARDLARSTTCSIRSCSGTWPAPWPNCRCSPTRATPASSCS